MLHTLVSLVQEIIVRIDMNIRSPADFNDRVVELRSSRTPHGHKRSFIETNFH